MSNRKRIGTLCLLPVSGLAAVTRLCPCGGARRRVQNEWRSMAKNPQNPLFSGYNFLSSNLNVVFERRCKEITHCLVLDFLESLICFKKSFKVSMTSYTSYDQRYCFTAILQALWCVSRSALSFLSRHRQHS